MRREAALVIGALGTLILAVVQVALGADPTTLRDVVSQLGVTLAPLVTAIITRGAVYARDSVDRVRAEAVEGMSAVLPPELALEVVRAAEARGEGAVRDVITWALRRVQEQEEVQR